MNRRELLKSVVDAVVVAPIAAAVGVQPVVWKIIPDRLRIGCFDVADSMMQRPWVKQMLETDFRVIGWKKMPGWDKTRLFARSHLFARAQVGGRIPRYRIVVRHLVSSHAPTSRVVEAEPIE